MNVLVSKGYKSYVCLINYIKVLKLSFGFDFGPLDSFSFSSFPTTLEFWSNKLRKLSKKIGKNYYILFLCISSYLGL